MLSCMPTMTVVQIDHRVHKIKVSIALTKSKNSVLLDFHGQVI